MGVNDQEGKEGKLPKIYLVNAIFAKNEDNQIVAKPGTVRPIINTVIAIDDAGSKAAIQLKQDEDGKANGIDANNESMQVYITDATGCLCNFDTGKEDDSGSIKTEPFKSGPAVKAISENAKLYFPPKRAILYNLLSNGYEGWVDNLRKVLKGIEKAAIADLPPSISLSEQLKASDTMLVKKHFIKPEGVAVSASEQAYSQWYTDNKEKNVLTLVLPRTRGIVISFSSKIYDKATVTIRDNAGNLRFQGAAEGKKPLAKHTAVVKEIMQKQAGGEKDISVGFTAVFYDTDDVIGQATSIKDQVFRIEVTIPELLGNPLSGVTYSFAERFRFGISNLAGDFELINGDALSLEESMVKQFPTLYSKDQIAAGGESKFASYAHFASTANSIADMASSVLGAGDVSGSFNGQKATRKIGQHLVSNVSVLGEPIYEGVGLKDIVNIGFSTYDLAGSYGDCMTDSSLSSEKIVNGVTKVKRGIDAVTGAMTGTALGSKLEAAATIIGNKISTSTLGAVNLITLPPGVQHWLQSSHNFVATNKISDKLGVAGSILELGTAAYNFYETDANQDKAIKQFQISATTYANLINMSPAKPEDKTATEGTQEAQTKSKHIISEFKKSYGKKRVMGSLNGERVYVKIGFQFDQYAFEMDKDKVEKYNKDIKTFVETLNNAGLGAETVVHLVGHTCERGDLGYNQSLSEKRAKAVSEEMKSLGAKFTVIPSGRGENDAGEGLSQAERRRVEAVIEINKAKRYYPSREGMDEFERYRALSLLYSRAENEQIAAAAKSTIDLALCIPWVPHVVAAKLIWEAGGVIMDAGALLNKLINGTDYVNLVKKHDNLMVEARDNLIAMNLAAQNEKDKRAAYLQSQYQLRAETLYGLMRLLTRCAIEVDDSYSGKFSRLLSHSDRDDLSYLGNIKYYRVNDYIDRFVLNDGWKLPESMLLPITLDQHWIQIVEQNLLDEIIASSDTSALEKAEALMERHTGVDVLSLATTGGKIEAVKDVYEWVKDSVLGSPLQGIDYIRFSGSDEFKYRDDMMTAQYQRFFPIHYMAADDIDDFSGKFKNDFSGIDDDTYSLFCISARDFASQKEINEGWVPLKERLDSEAGLSPVDQIRISVFLDHTKITKQIDDDSIRYMPVQVRPIRDAWVNIDGVATKDFIQKIEVRHLTSYEKEHLLDLGYLKKEGGEYKLVDSKPLYGAILTPFYTYGPNRFYGTRPMARSLESWWESDEKDGEENSYKIDAFWGGSDTWTMEYFYKVMLANRPDSEKEVTYLVGKDDDGSKKYEDEFTLTIDPERVHSVPGGNGKFSESKLLRPHFLASRTEKEVIPELFEGANSMVLLRNGKSGEYVDAVNILEKPLGDSGTDTTMRFNSFDWSKPVDVIVLVVANNLNKAEYNDLKLPWKTLPVTITASDDSLLSADGPTYRSTLKYVGVISGRRGSAKFEQNEDSSPLDGGLKKLKEYLSNPEHVYGFKHFGSAKHFGGNYAVDRHVYAVHISLTYKALTGVTREGLRPHFDGREYLQENLNPSSIQRAHKPSVNPKLRFRVSTPGDSGFNSTNTEGVFYLKNPDGFTEENSHWYPKPDPSMQRAVEEFHAMKDEREREGGVGNYYTEKILYSDWSEWIKLSTKDKWWSTKRAERVNEWLNDKKGSTDLPKGPSLSSEV
jgi:outer membrane protein OmpA-like peptidoglycan-associated protein